MESLDKGNSQQNTALYFLIKLEMERVVYTLRFHNIPQQETEDLTATILEAIAEVLEEESEEITRRIELKT